MIVHRCSAALPRMTLEGMASDWGQNWSLDFVASKGPTRVETSSSGHRFRFFVASLSWLGCDALFVLSFSSCRRIALLMSACCPFRRLRSSCPIWSPIWRHMKVYPHRIGKVTVDTERLTCQRVRVLLECLQEIGHSQHSCVVSYPFCVCGKQRL